MLKLIKRRIVNLNKICHRAINPPNPSRNSAHATSVGTVFAAATSDETKNLAMLANGYPSHSSLANKTIKLKIHVAAGIYDRGRPLAIL
jgi:hypothetical protein